MLPIQVEAMTHSQKVAALMIVLGPAAASEIMKNITDDDVLEQITLDIAAMNKLPIETLEAIVEEFHTIFQANSMLASGGMSYAKTLLEKAYGTEQANNLRLLPTAQALNMPKLML